MSTSFQNRMSTLVASTAASALSSTAMTASQTNDPRANAGIVLQGYYRKLKTMKKKYFVLYSDTKDRSARLEYYDSEKKFKTNFGHPKRTIVLRTCFNINRRTDTKHKWVVALYTKDDCFCIVFDTEQDLNTWLRSLLSLQRGDDSTGDPPRPNFEHTWSVQVQRKGLAEDKGIIGNYHLCLTEKSLTLVRVGAATTTGGDHRLGSVEFLLTTIRRCGNTQCFFYMEVGRHSAIGAGELWMETQDPFIAENMHQTIITASASCKNREDYIGPVRPRSSSANEASKPISMAMRRQTHVGQKPMNFSPSGGSAMKRERCDSLPSRNRAISESSQQNNTSMPPPRSIPSNRPHSMYNRHSNSPPVNSCPLSPSGACSESDGSSLSIDETDGFGQSLTPDEYGHHFRSYMGGMSQESAILEENSDEYWNGDKKLHSMYDRNHRGITQNGTSLSLPIAQSQGQRKGSPAPPVGSVEGRSSYIEMYSPCGSSPGDPTGSSGYLPMSPGVDFGRGVYTGSSGVHSRASSLAEEGVDGGSQHDQYVDMDASHRHHGMSGMSSAASSSSITSGTPSTDTRFADYPLEKVFARFTPDEEDNSSRDRPIRAYSVGSRMEHNKRKFRIDLLNTDNSSLRARAFSLGSRAKVPRSEQYKSGHSQSTIAQTNLANNNGSAKGGKKSSSAPMLDKRTNQELMDDFMEIDFSRGDEETPTSTMPMPALSSQSSESCNFPHDITYGGRTADTTDGYVEMRPVAVTKSPSLSSSPVKSYMSPRTVPLRSLVKNNNNMDMSPVLGRAAPSGAVLATSPKTSTTSDDYLNMSPVEGIHEKMDVDMPRMSSAPEGYIEMSWPKNSKTVNNNTIPEKPASDEYINMSFQGVRRNGGAKRESSGNGQRMTSMPINIQQGKQNLYAGRSSLTGKSESQQSFLPLTGGSTGQQPAHRSESKDSGIVTPTGSNAAIFPFSPSSPMKPFQHVEARKCLVDGTSGTLMLAEEEVSHGSSGVATPTTPVPMEGISTEECSGKGLRKCHAEEMLENRYVDSVTQQTKIRRLSMEVPDYVNCPPVGVRKITPSVSPLRNSAEDVAGDYVLMRPSTTTASTTVPKRVTPLSNNSSQISLNTFEGFIPIASAEEAAREEKVVSPRITHPSSLKRPFWYGKESDGSFDSLRVASRPNSVNSDKITSKISSLSLNRPNSANSDHVPPISSSSSASTLCGSSSSSSTLCGSKSPSSATLMRPQSFTESSSSRPDSVADISSRPPSVTSERELHYASLDLPPCSAGAAGVAPLARQEATELSSSSASSKNTSLSGDSSASPSPNAAPVGAQVAPVAFNYAQIDFTKCENAKATTPN
ncbi:insulin receptor substrate 2-B [Phlebotomus argentipes]|uniref:insulin receptor substrate 2-B n=1 Tax=Phlebotomus argentipes TaxID=94469 RepID=UPI002893440D|nr:insulin receptor substrate 2-B [Phlebotomus argentipes]XP_059618388.1 insulin receptor substrate 2-B [Phlebotomus argentipes]XP_059618389.1 insulin receptor substrate 2-B [Phlebotomus argentipes]XP_059618390.1 insulin receptor substrate 2-B [Phlebotomus argentipes]